MTFYCLIFRSGGEKVDDIIVQDMLTKIVELFSQVDGMIITSLHSRVMG